MAPKCDLASASRLRIRSKSRFGVFDSSFGFFLEAVKHVDEASGCPEPGMAIGPSVSPLAKPLGAPSRLRPFQLYPAGSRRELVCSFGH
jgi:hypothetical protein